MTGTTLPERSPSAGRGWPQAPEPPQQSGGAAAATIAAAFWIALIGPVVSAMAVPGARWGWLLAVGSVAVVVMLVTPPRRWQVRLAVAVAAGAVVAPSLGERLALWLAASLLLASWVALGRAPVPGMPRPGQGATPPVVVLTAVAAWQGHEVVSTARPLLPFALAWLMPLASRLGGGALHRTAARLGTAVGNVVSATVFGVLGWIVVALPWATRKLTRTDPLRAAPGWRRRDRQPVHARRPWADEQAADSSGLRWRFPIAVMCFAALALGVWWTRHRDEPSVVTGIAGSADQPLMNAPTGEDGSWYDQYLEDIAWAMDENVAFRPFEIYRVRDVETRHVNVHDGERDTWTPAPCDRCQRLVVWFYGGSGAFGFGQRDNHTIASELARIAADEGILLDVRNRGVPGQAHWRAALRFSWDLTYDPTPDLVVFYDGAEEVDAAVALRTSGRGDVRAPYEGYVESVYDDLYGSATTWPAPEGVEALGWPTVPEEPVADDGHLAARRYLRSRALSTTTAERHDVPVRYVWQPTDLPRSEDGDIERLRSAHRSAVLALPADVIVPDGGPRDGRIDYLDGIQPSEDGARRIASNLFDELRSTLTDLQGRGG